MCADNEIFFRYCRNRLSHRAAPSTETTSSHPSTHRGITYDTGLSSSLLERVFNCFLALYLLMDLSSLLTDEGPPRTAVMQRTSARSNMHGPPNRSLHTSLPKKVAFELLLDEGSKTRARIPMRVLINPHDTTESIITTVKNFYGIYEGHGVTFEDDRGNTLIACYENLINDMVVYVRTVAGPPQFVPAISALQYHGSPMLEQQRKASLGEAFQMLPPQNNDHPYSPSRPASRLAWKRSVSPASGRGRRSQSQQKAGTISNAASRGSSAHGSHHDDAMNGFSDSDGGQSSIAGSRKARSEQFASAEISLENVVQDSRRKGPSFDSSVNQGNFVISDQY